MARLFEPIKAQISERSQLQRNLKTQEWASAISAVKQTETNILCNCKRSILLPPKNQSSIFATLPAYTDTCMCKMRQNLQLERSVMKSPEESSAENIQKYSTLPICTITDVSKSDRRGRRRSIFLRLHCLQRFGPASRISLTVCGTTINFKIDSEADITSVILEVTYTDFIRHKLFYIVLEATHIVLDTLLYKQVGKGSTWNSLTIR